MAKQRRGINTEADSDYMAGMFHANILLAEEMHETMKEIRLARRYLTRSDVRLCRLYQEAVEQYIDAGPQQQLLREYRNNTKQRTMPPPKNGHQPKRKRP